MNTHRPGALASGLVAAAALVLSMKAGAQEPAPATPSSASPAAVTSTGHAKHHSSIPKPAADMKAECEAMMAKKQEMGVKVQAMDASLDKLVAEMNAAKGSKEVDAMEKPMAAVINELVLQRKAMRTMMMEMEPAMMGHMAHHMKAHGAKGAMECPMMKSGAAPGSGM